MDVAARVPEAPKLKVSTNCHDIYINEEKHEAVALASMPCCFS